MPTNVMDRCVVPYHVRILAPQDLYKQTDAFMFSDKIKLTLQRISDIYGLFNSTRTHKSF